MTILCLVALCVWWLLRASPTAAVSLRCGMAVEYPLASPDLHCLHHNATTPTTAVLHLSGKVSSSLQLLPGQPLELPSQATGTLYLRSSHTICYSLFRTGCNEVVRGRKEGGKETRDAHVVKADEEEAVNRLSAHGLLLLQVTLSALALLVLPPLALAAFLCCPGGKIRTQTNSNRRLSRKDRRKGLSASTDISINITDSDHPLGSDHFTTFHKFETQGSRPAATQQTPSPVSLANVRGARSAPSLLEESSLQNTQYSSPLLLESTLDIGTRQDSSYDVQHLGASVSSMHSLGPRVSPEGSSVGNLSAFEKRTSHFSSSSQQLPPGMPPPPSIPPPPSHLRQHSNPVFFPSSPPPHKPRPQTIIGKPTDHPSVLSPSSPIPGTQTAQPPNPRSPPSSPPLSPVSLSESEVLCPLAVGRVRPYRVVHQPSISLSFQSNQPHSCDGTLCVKCGARLSGIAEAEPLHLVSEEGSEEGSGVGSGAESGVEPQQDSDDQELCQQCQSTSPNYQKLKSSEDGALSSPPPIPLRDGAPVPDPVYERIGSIRRHFTTTSNNDSFGDRSKVSSASQLRPTSNLPATSPTPEVRLMDPLLYSVSPQRSSRFPACPLPSEGAPLPSRPPTLGLLMNEAPDTENHDYESLPSTFGVDSPGDTVYASIPSPVEEEPDTPPYNSQRAQMLKIDSQGYAEVVNKEEGKEPTTPDPDPGHSPATAMASDYEVPVRISSHPVLSPLHQPPATSPSHFHYSPTYASHPSPTYTSHPSPIPVPSPVPPSPNLHPAPHTLHHPSEGLVTSATPPHLKRQAAISDNPLPLPARSPPARSLQVLPREEKGSLDNRRDSAESVASYSLTYRFSTASSALGESMTESLRAITEEDLLEAVEQVEKMEREGEASEPGEVDQQTETRRHAKLKQKIYEVENRSRTKSYPSPVLKPLGEDTHIQKARTMRMRISFNQDSQTV